MSRLGKVGQTGLQMGQYRVKRESELGHMGCPGHVVWVMWVTWATGLVKYVKWLLGLLNFMGKDFRLLACIMDD